MGNFDRGGGGRFGGNRGGGGFGGRDSGRGNSGGKSWGGGKPWDRDRQITMHQAVCSNCGNKCEVPFRPNGSKPVLCNNCFAKTKSGDMPSNNFPSNNFAKREYSATPPFHPVTGDKGDKRIDELRKQLDAANSKLDTLIKAMVKPVVAETPAEVKIEAKKTTLKKLVKKATSSKKK